MSDPSPLRTSHLSVGHLLLLTATCGIAIAMAEIRWPLVEEDRSEFLRQGFVALGQSIFAGVCLAGAMAVVQAYFRRELREFAPGHGILLLLAPFALATLWALAHQDLFYHTSRGRIWVGTWFLLEAASWIAVAIASRRCGLWCVVALLCATGTTLAGTVWIVANLAMPGFVLFYRARDAAFPRGYYVLLVVVIFSLVVDHRAGHKRDWLHHLGAGALIAASIGGVMANTFD